MTKAKTAHPEIAKATLPIEHVAALTYVARAVCNDETRFHMNGILLDFATGNIVATDGHRLYMATGALGESESEAQATLPDYAVKPWLALHKGETVAAVEYNAESNRITLLNLRGTMCVPAVEEQFPSYDQVIPKDLDTQITMRASALAQALKQAMAQKCPGDNGERPRTIAITRTMVTLGDGEAPLAFAPVMNYESDTDYVLREIEATYLKDALTGLAKDAEVTLYVNAGSPLDPIKLTTGKYTAVIMPRRI